MKNNQQGLSREQINSVISLYSKGHYPEAIERIKSLNNDYPNVPLLFNLIGACYQQIGQIEGASKMFATAVNLKPDYSSKFREI
jgi:tetratricopeptide (TPR) repeat protein